MFKKAAFFLLTAFAFLLITAPSVKAEGLSWFETRPAGDQNRGWSTVSLSSDGHKMIVGNQDGGLFISHNGGSSWTQVSPSGFDTDVWYVSAMSAEGNVILAGVYGGYLYLSRDGGNTWSEAMPAGHTGVFWNDVSMSLDGQVIFIASDGGRLYRTADGGGTWSEVRPLGDQDLNWRTSVSDDGQIVLASEDGGSGGRLYISRDTGNSWNETQPNGNSNYGWTSVGMSANGTIMLATISADSVYISRNGGVSWTQVENLNGLWIRAWISPDGSTMFLSNTNRLFLSSDTGHTWSETQPVGDVDKSWQALTMSRNLRVLLAGSYDGRLYIGWNLPVQTSETSQQCGITPASPDLFQMNTTKTTATLYFAPVASASKYQISYGYDGNANNFSVVTGLGASTGVLSYTVNELPSKSTMYFKVYAQNDCARGNWSNTMTVKTDEKVYYKNLLSRVLSILPKQTTTLNAQKLVTTCTTYTVQPGDSLWSIASSQLGSGGLFGQIQKSNNLPSSLIHTGQSLKIGCS